ncbi:hypothetical protein NF556_19900 [Ornithinimicrobium faecis]|uniref:Alkaline phosphatase n=1 Tax=Ornithinimicrobium faecis TaxID=2934158 RepID=A0ABY4YST7_9MICO|nr:hypothetical protein [Ornithinimicrobium sp. HY1793]USQ79822.1 hypothetical protein NF556_19900 [Ornithinimicrobium sp. HY1793]
MSKRVCAVALAATLSVTIAGPGIAAAEPGDAGASTAEATSAEGPKNVIYLVGDGMSFNQVDTGSLYGHGTSNYQARVDHAVQAQQSAHGIRGRYSSGTRPSLATTPWKAWMSRK